MNGLLPYAAVAFIKIVIVLVAVMTAAAYLVLVERWIAAWVQDRRGPNRVGIPLTKLRMFGLGQPLADGLKFILKQEYIPKHVDRVLYVVAPVSVLVAALAVFAAIPLGNTIPPLGTAEPIELVVSAAPPVAVSSESGQVFASPPFDVGVIYVFALGSLAVYGVILGGWASNDKYSFLGGLRSSAQLIAYELPLGLGLLGVVLFAGSLRLDEIILTQAKTGQWNLFVQPLGFVVFLVASFAEAARLPFDLPECEQELIGGYHTEYSGIKLLMYLVGEFLHMITAAFLIVILFLGGWHIWGMPLEGAIGWGQAILRVVVLMAKVLLVILFFMLVRWSWPRFRFDQLMNLAWKVMLPLGLVNLVAVAVVCELTHDQAAGPDQPLPLTYVVVGWVVFVASWVGMAAAGAYQTENRPQRGTLGLPAGEKMT